MYLILQFNPQLSVHLSYNLAVHPLIMLN